MCSLIPEGLKPSVKIRNPINQVECQSVHLCRQLHSKGINLIQRFAFKCGPFLIYPNIFLLHEKPNPLSHPSAWHRLGYLFHRRRARVARCPANNNHIDSQPNFSSDAAYFIEARWWVSATHL